MEQALRLLKIQCHSWFFPHKEYFCKLLRKNSPFEFDIFAEWLDAFPEFRERVFFPLRLPELIFPMHLLVYGQSNYPKKFYLMQDPPLVLCAYGKAPWMEADCLSVVGSRQPTGETLQWLSEELGSFMESRDVVIVSGGARGVDQAAHGLALKKKKPTVVFLPAGLAEVYPTALQEWIPSILKYGGCILSEYFPSQKMEKSLFHHRNRLIAQMSLATLIVQAAEKSGTLMTGHLSAECGTPLWIVPAHPLQRPFAGNIKLLKEGGTLVANAHDLSLFFEAEKVSGNLKAAYLERFWPINN